MTYEETIEELKRGLPYMQASGAISSTKAGPRQPRNRKMKISDAKLLAPIIQAWADGKAVEYRHNHSSNWIVCDNCMNWEAGPEFYRIKPEPSYRAWRLSDNVVGYVVRHKISDSQHLITDAYIAGPIINNVQISWQFLFEDYTRQDGVSLCGVPIT